MGNLSRKAIEEYKAIYKKVYGDEISCEKAAEQGTELLELFQVIYRPINQNKNSNK